MDLVCPQIHCIWNEDGQTQSVVSPLKHGCSFNVQLDVNPRFIDCLMERVPAHRTLMGLASVGKGWKTSRHTAVRSTAHFHMISLKIVSTQNLNSYVNESFQVWNTVNVIGAV